MLGVSGLLACDAALAVVVRGGPNSDKDNDEVELAEYVLNDPGNEEHITDHACCDECCDRVSSEIPIADG